MAWRYACNIPTYITGKDENGEPVVLYRVNVFFQQQNPDGATSGSSNVAPGTDSAPFFVLRRYSQFRHLHEQLKAAFPAAMSGRGMAPPPKHPLVLGDKRDALERRRGELERWLWRLVATPEVARGSQLKAFLELDKALTRAQQRQQQHQRLMLLDSGLDAPRGSSSTTPPSESGYGAGRNHNNLTAYAGGGGGASVLGDDSASDTSGPSGGGSTAGAPSSTMAAAAAAGPAGGGTLHDVLLPDPRVAVSGRGDMHEYLHQHQQHGMPAAAATVTAPFDAGSAAGASTARLGIHLQSRGDVRRLVDLLVRRLEVVSSEASSAVSEVSMLRDANRAMAERLGEMELARAGEEQVEEVRTRLAESEAARSSLEQRLIQLDETLASRSAAHAQQICQLQSQLVEARADNTHLLRRLEEWDVGGSHTAVALAAAQQRAEELQQLLDEGQRRWDEQQQHADEQRRRADELQKWVDEQTRGSGSTERERHEDELQGRLRQMEREIKEAMARVDELQGRLKEQEQLLDEERKGREPPVAPSPAKVQAQLQQKQQTLLDRARADNALLAQEVQRLRAAAAAEREAHKAALALHSQASAQLAGRVRELEAQLAAAPVQTQELLLL